MKQKIAIICDYKLLPNRVGGMDYFFWEFNKKCKSNNIDIDWYFPNYSDHGYYSDLTIFAPPEGETLIEYVKKKIEKSNNQYTHIVTHFVELCTSFFKSIKKHTDANILAVDHNPRPLRGYSFQKRIKKKIKGILYSKYIDTFVGVSRYTVNEIVNDFGSHLKSKTIVLYNGVLIDDIQINANRLYEQPRFIVACHLRKSKGIQDLIEAIKNIDSNEINGITIDIYGYGPYRDHLETKVNNYQLNGVFQFKGSVANLNEIYKNYDYMILPSHMECFSLAILESLAANVPVISSNVGGNEEAISHGNNGYIFQTQDIHQLSQIIKDVFHGNKKITINTRTEIEQKYSLDVMVNQYFELLV